MPKSLRLHSHHSAVKLSGATSQGEGKDRAIRERLLRKDGPRHVPCEQPILAHNGWRQQANQNVTIGLFQDHAPMAIQSSHETYLPSGSDGRANSQL